MNVLIAGGSGFIGLNLAERFLKDGHSVAVVDIVEPTIKLRPRSRASFYSIGITDPDVEEAFKDKLFDIVFNCTLAQEDTQESHLSMITGNINLVSLSIKYNVKKYIYLSNSDMDFVENNSQEFSEEELMAAKYFTLNKKTSEEYTYEALHDTSVQKVIIRLPMVLGKGMKQNFESYYFTKFIYNVLNNTHKGNSKLQNEFEVISIGDCVNQILELTLKDESPHNFFRLEGTTVGANEFVNLLASIYPIENRNVEIVNKKDPANFKKKVVKVVKNQRTMEDFQNNFKNSFFWFIENKNKKGTSNKNNKVEILKNKKGMLFGISENILGMMLSYAGCIYSNGHFDANLPYIMFVGIRHGLSNAFFAVFISVIMKFFIINSIGTFQMVEFIYMMISYLLAAFISSFITDKQKGILESVNRKQKLVEEKLENITKRLNQSRKTISTLSEQIKVSDKSFGKVHQATRKLDNFNTQNLFKEMKNVVREITNFKKVHIYTVNRNEWVLDLYANVKEDVIGADAIIYINEDDIFQDIIFKRKLFINKHMDTSLPGVIIPIVDQENERVEAMILINDIPFESLNAFTEYTLQMTGELLSDALTRAYKFETLQQGFSGYFDNLREGSLG